MFFRKGKLRKEGNERLLQTLEQLKFEWMNKKKFVEQSFEPSESVLHELRLAEAKYFFLLKEAKKRQVSGRSLK
ncbi:YaaL family protein [Bacillus taeanensis]|uniref:DUF2508 domain-containing protein n=1 Tax=Bacillus taeanensis TaxID=273032 RepID=A0A366XQE0_9BACI|nr:YaaL family protein [Bacillus taeanensis]RBW67325.1 DUF2508 domain-containing protein [Bacillus taeanensis]